ncbi:hypothetical protein [Oceaniglobus trochenteri]|uniref:hypothetical protein n=1 Tax=Oceaniglobus trochenteri TaxID=2763260 RepID=UPI001D001537|nr:hypothetical protein [Oceaniglobus trochenteri]
MPILQTESETAIVQRALGLAESANSFDSLEDDSDEAREGRLRYDHRRRVILEAIDWNFARARIASVAAQPNAFPANQPYAYALPPNLLRVRNVMVGTRPVSWSRERLIYAAEPNAQIVYTWDERNPVLFSPIFTSALEYLLAADFSMIFARSVNRQQVMLQELRRVMQDADEIEGMERSDDCAYATGGWVDAIEIPHFGGRI